MKELTRIDPLTGEAFIPKRVNHIYVTPSNRKKFNNQKNEALRKERAKINGPLNKTHRLLKKLMEGKNDVKHSKDFLKGYGVELSLFNHVVKINGVPHYAIFEFVLIFLDNNIVKIVRNGRY